MVKRLMILAVVLALAVAAPAMAQVEQDFKQDTESGDVDQSFTVTGGGVTATNARTSLVRLTPATSRTARAPSSKTPTPGTPSRRISDLISR